MISTVSERESVPTCSYSGRRVEPGCTRAGQAWSPPRRARGRSSSPGWRDGAGGGAETDREGRRHESRHISPETRRLPSRRGDTKAPVLARLFCAPPRRREGQARSSGSLPPCACGLIQAKKRFCFVLLPSWELISGRLPSGDVFVVKNVKRAEQSATQSPKENPEGRVPAAPCGPRSSPGAGSPVPSRASLLSPLSCALTPPEPSKRSSVFSLCWPSLTG